MHRRTAGIFTCIASFAAAHGQYFQNLDFEQACDTCKSGLASWSVSWQSAGVTCAADGPRSDRSLVISGTSATGVGFVEQAAMIPHTEEFCIASVSVLARCEGVQGGRGAGIYLQGYDHDGNLVLSKDLGYGSFKWISGTREEQRYALKAVCPGEVSSLRIGFILYGAGRVWFDDVHFSTSFPDGHVPGPDAAAYVNAACDTIALHSLRRDSIDLPALRAMGLRIAGNADDPEDRHLAVEYLLQALGDHHSFFMDPEVKRMWEGEVADPGTIEQATHRIINGYGYLAVPQFQSNDQGAMLSFADTIQQALKSLDTQGAKGWIIDLRKNTGGNMTPMVCGLGPLFDPGVLGQLVDVNGMAQKWFYADGVYGWDGEEELRAPRPVELKRKLPIAVLISGQTGSSGECTTISFIGNSRTRLFGQPTWGLTTGNGNFDLPDGARMFMASTIMGDRDGNLFHGPIPPDVVVEQPADWSYDAALDAALTWLDQQH